MNRKRLTILRDHLTSLPDERVDMSNYFRRPDAKIEFDHIDVAADIVRHDCGTAACIAGWTCVIWPGASPDDYVDDFAERQLGLTNEQAYQLFFPRGYEWAGYTRSDAIAAIQSMLDNPSDDALPVWPEVSK